MSCFKSGVAVKVSPEVQVLMSEKTESHEEIRAEHGIRGDRAHTPITLHPVGGIDPGKPDMWELEFYDARPGWWTDDMTSQATTQMLSFVARHFLPGGEFQHSGDVKMERLKTWPPSTPFTSHGYAILPSVAAWGAGSHFVCGLDAFGHVELVRPAIRPANTPFTSYDEETLRLTAWGTRGPSRCGHRADLQSLATWPPNTRFQCDGNALLVSLTTWGPGSLFVCGGHAHLESVADWGTQSPFQCGGDATLSSLTAWPANTLFKCEGSIRVGRRWQKPDDWLREHAARASA